ncbi:MAG: glycosyltransferase family 39 protein [Bacteroidota bacterium]
MSLPALFSEERIKRRIFFACAALILAIMVSVSGDYGISWDEPLQKDYGNRILRYYSSGGKDTSYIDRAKLIHLYGGLAETITALANRLSSHDVYDTRHLVIACFGFLAILFSGLLARELAGWNTGTLALLFAFLTPVFFGHSMYNSKDIPFAAAYAISIYFLTRFIRQLPKPATGTCLGLALGIAMAINIRIGGLLLIAYLLFFWLAGILSLLAREKDMPASRLRQIRMSFLYPLLIGTAAYFLGLLFWPYGLAQPFRHPFEALRLMSNYDVFDSMNLFEGRWIHRWEIPWYYIPKWIWITVPLFISLGLVLLPFAFSKKWIGRAVTNRYLLAVTCFVFLFPIVYIIVRRSNVYDGWRHLFFVLPPLAAAAAVVWASLIRSLSRKAMRAAAALLLAGTMLQPAAWMYRNHPFESFYFSPLAGGINGAFKKYEIDYYGTSLRQAVEWIAENSDKNRVNKVRNWYGEKECTEHFIRKYRHLKYVFVNEESLDWDYAIVLPVQAKFDSLLLKNWPPRGTVHQAFADDAPIFAIVKNYRTPEMVAESIANAVYASTDVNALIASSLHFYNQGNYLMCVAASERALMLDPANKYAFNNISSAFNGLKLYNEAAEAGKMALAIDPGFAPAQGNYAEARARQKDQVPADTLSIHYTNLSVVYSRLGQLERSIAFCQFAIRYKPDNAYAYNNLCSAFNAIGNYAEAVKYGEKAVELDPSSELFRNNLQTAKKGLRP